MVGGKRHGEYRAWWANGHPKCHCFYESGQLHGEYKSWYDNGQMELLQIYRNGMFHGERKWWTKSGKLKSHSLLIAGKPVINFMEEPSQYPKTSEDRLAFVLKFGVQLLNVDS